MIPWWSLLALAAALSVAAAIRPRPAALPLAAALGSLAVTAAYRGAPQPPGLWFPFEFFPLLVLQVRLLRRAPARTAAVAGALVGLATSALPLRITLHVPHNRLNASILLVAVAFCGAVAAAGTGLLIRAADARRARALEAARRSQRLELARDLHDLVAHEVTGIVVEAQAAQIAPDPRSYERIEAAGQRALAAMDDMVAALRSPDARAYGLADIPLAVARYGPKASLSIDPGSDLSPAAGSVAYSVVIEALTNVRRHAAPSAEVVVRLTARGVLTVESDMSDVTPQQRPGGTGLVSLAERVQAVGGTLRAGPANGRWKVTADLSHSADVRRGGVEQP
ncbi:histidine kinase [Dactylosporangium sp. NPDC051485]|uniref:sensor histidine kinase n=1 Tax=Dactylosporangium sp. NPDC051485 TaxID=3154846 RepID=UPI00343E6AF8